ncbi:MAG TPA: ComEC/Rec2 family competence protein, partial [Patescibacteria group bacterium]|nr:ComEC/Rec2 family competence protein [Patescibacteria group bacterium]
MKPAQKIFIGFVLILVIFLYFFRLQSVSRLKIPEGREITLKGRVSQQPYLKDSYQIIYLGPVFLETHRFPGYFYGDRLVVTGRFEKRVINPFDTRYSAYFPDIQNAEEEGKEDFLFSFKGSLYNFRGRLEKVIAGVLPEPQASLMIGILLGVKKEMPENFLNNLRDTGTLHIIVASGYNLSVIAGFLVSFLVWLMNRKKALVVAFLGVLFYTLMVGAEPPVVRAAIMAGLAYTAKYLGRMSDGLITLLVTAIIMLLLSPLILFDIGFQLSLTATAGI